MDQAPVRQGQHLFRRQRILTILPERLFRRQALGHRLVAVNRHRQDARLALQPQLVEIFLQLAADPQIVNQNIAVGREGLLV